MEPALDVYSTVTLCMEFAIIGIEARAHVYREETPGFEKLLQ